MSCTAWLHTNGPVFCQCSRLRTLSQIGTSGAVIVLGYVMRRLDSITTLQSFGIFLVVLGHSFTLRNTGGVQPIVAEWIYYFIYSFHMPLFVFISGFLFIHTNAGRKVIYSRFLSKKVKRLFVPYLIISTIAFVIKVILPQHAMRPIALSFSDYIRGLAFPQYNPIIFFWFLPTIFILLSIAPLIKIIIVRTNVLVSLGILPLLMALNIFDPVEFNLFGLRTAVATLVYFYTGCLAAHYFRGKLHSLGNCYLLIILFIALVLTTAFSVKLGQVIKLLPATIGIAFSISLARLIKNTNIFGPLHGYSYQIYLLSWFPQAFFQMLYRMGLIGYWIAACAMLFVGLYFPVMTARLVQEKFGKLRVAIGL